MHQEIRITRVVFESLALRVASGMCPIQSHTIRNLPFDEGGC